MVLNGKPTCGYCLGDTGLSVVNTLIPKGNLNTRKCEDKYNMHKCGTGCCCHAGFSFDMNSVTCKPDDIKYVGEWDDRAGTCTRVIGEESERTGKHKPVDRLISDQVSPRAKLVVTASNVECQIPNSQKWQKQVFSSCEKNNAYKCGPKILTGKRAFCCCRTGCRFLVQGGKATCGDCQDEHPDVKERLIPETKLKRGTCKDKFRMHPCGSGCCCNAGFSFHERSWRCVQDEIKMVGQFDIPKSKCTKVVAFESRTGKIEKLAEPLNIPGSGPNALGDVDNGSLEDDEDQKPTFILEPEDDKGQEPAFSLKPEDDKDQEPTTTPKPPPPPPPFIVLHHPHTNSGRFPIWLFPAIVSGVVLVSVIAFHYMGGARAAAQ